MLEWPLHGLLELLVLQGIDRGRQRGDLGYVHGDDPLLERHQPPVAGVAIGRFIDA